MDQALPRRISPDPILESLMELRFTPAVPPDALLGLVFGAVRHWFPQMVPLPAANVPEAIRQQDPNLIWQATHQLVAGHLLLKVGPRVICFSSLRRYDGWPAWSAFRQTVLDALGQTGVIAQVDRLALRYINFFRQPILDELNLGVQVVGQPVADWSSTLRFEIPDSGLLKNLQIANRINLQIDGENIPGSILDIDCVQGLSLDGPGFIQQHQALGDQLHQKIKELFFGLLKPEFLAGFTPEY